MKIDWLMVHVTHIGPHTRAESKGFDYICTTFDVFWPSWTIFVVGEALCGL